jgi:hypothetical protein
LKHVFLEAKVVHENMLDNHYWDVSVFVRCFDLPNNTFNHPFILEMRKLGLVSPKLPEVVESNLVFVVSCRNAS